MRAVISATIVAVLAALCVIVFLNVIGRTLFSSLTWSVELSRFLLVYLVFLGAALAYQSDEHFKVDLLTSKLPRVLQRALELCVHLVALGILCLFGVGSWALVVANVNDTASVIGISYSVMYAAGVICSALMGLSTVIKIYEVLSGSRRQRDAGPATYS